MCTNELLNTYSENNIRLIPCRGKVALIKNWPQKASSSQSQIEAWMKEFPGENWAMLTGSSGSGIFVVDVDKKNGGVENWAGLIEKNGEPITIKVKTPSGGFHYWFKIPDELIELNNSESKILPGIDIRADGGYAMAPPSKGYEFQEGFSISKLDSPPKWLVELLKTNISKRPSAVRVAAPSAAGRIPVGQRNTKLTRIAGNMRRNGLEESQIYEALLKINASACEEPLHDEEVRSIATSVSKYQPQKDYNQTDTGNALRLIDAFGDSIRFVPNWGWLVYSGDHWEVNEAAIMQHAQSVALKAGVVAKQQGDTEGAKWAKTDGEPK